MQKLILLLLLLIAVKGTQDWEFIMEIDDAMKEKMHAYFEMPYDHKIGYSNPNDVSAYTQITGHTLGIEPMIYPPQVWKFCDIGDNMCQQSKIEIGNLMVELSRFDKSNRDDPSRTNTDFVSMIPRHLRCDDTRKFVHNNGSTTPEPRLVSRSRGDTYPEVINNFAQNSAIDELVWKGQVTAADQFYSCEIRDGIWAQRYGISLHPPGSMYSDPGSQHPFAYLIGSFQFSDVAQLETFSEAHLWSRNDTLTWTHPMPDGIRKAIMQCADDCDKDSGCVAQTGKKWPCPYYSWHRMNTPFFWSLTFDHLFSVRQKMIEYLDIPDSDHDLYMFKNQDQASQDLKWDELQRMTGQQLIRRVGNMMLKSTSSDLLCNKFKDPQDSNGSARSSGCDYSYSVKEKDHCARVHEFSAYSGEPVKAICGLHPMIYYTKCHHGGCEQNWNQSDPQYTQTYHIGWVEGYQRFWNCNMSYSKKVTRNPSQTQYDNMFIDKKVDHLASPDASMAVCDSKYQSHIEKDYKLFASTLTFLNMNYYLLGMANNGANLPTMALMLKKLWSYRCTEGHTGSGFKDTCHAATSWNYIKGQRASDHGTNSPMSAIFEWIAAAVGAPKTTYYNSESDSYNGTIEFDMKREHNVDLDKNEFVSGGAKVSLTFTDWELCYQEYQFESDRDGSRVTGEDYGANDHQHINSVQKFELMKNFANCEKYQSTVNIDSDFIVRPKSYNDCLSDVFGSCPAIRHVGRLHADEQPGESWKHIALHWLPSVCKLQTRPRELEKNEGACTLKMKKMDHMNHYYYLEFLEGQLSDSRMAELYSSMKTNGDGLPDTMSNTIRTALQKTLDTQPLKLSHCIEKQIKSTSYDLWCELGTDGPLRYHDLDANQKSEWMLKAKQLINGQLGGDWTVTDDNGVPTAHMSAEVRNTAGPGQLDYDDLPGAD